MNTYGFIPSEIIEEEQFLLGDGCLPADVIFKDGHGWGDYLPSDDFQFKNGLETMNCTSYGTLHALATLGKKKFGIQFQANLSERFLGVLAGTTQRGNDPHRVCECVRKYGVMPEVFLPFGSDIDTWPEYYSPSPMTLQFLTYGQNWNRKYAFGHEWCFLPTDSLQVKQAKIKEALKYSPVCVSMYAWAKHSDGLYYKDGNDNHWIEIYDFVEGKYWNCFDSYDKTHKLIAIDSNFGQGKRFHLELVSGKIGDVEPQNFWQKLSVSFSSILEGIFSKYNE